MSFKHSMLIKSSSLRKSAKNHFKDVIIEFLKLQNKFIINLHFERRGLLIILSKFYLTNGCNELLNYLKSGKGMYKADSYYIVL